MNSKFWKNRNVFLTGHTGFKGGWTSLWLHLMGAKIHGYSLKPKKNSFFISTNLEKKFLAISVLLVFVIGNLKEGFYGHSRGAIIIVFLIVLLSEAKHFYKKSPIK